MCDQSVLSFHRHLMIWGHSLDCHPQYLTTCNLGSSHLRTKQHNQATLINESSTRMDIVSLTLWFCFDSYILDGISLNLIDHVTFGLCVKSLRSIFILIDFINCNPSGGNFKHIWWSLILVTFLLFIIKSIFSRLLICLHVSLGLIVVIINADHLQTIIIIIWLKSILCSVVNPWLRLIDTCSFFELVDVLIRGWLNIISILHIARLNLIYFLLVVAAGAAWTFTSTAAADAGKKKQEGYNEYWHKSSVP